MTTQSLELKASEIFLPGMTLVKAMKSEYANVEDKQLAVGLAIGWEVAKAFVYAGMAYRIGELIGRAVLHDS